MTIVDNKKLAYGLKWNLAYDDLAIELAMIRHGGRWTKNGKEHGEGLFYHYKKAQSLLWPEEDHHRWSDLLLKTIIDERITVVAGSKDSGKTRSMSKFALVDYWSWPDETLILMSSTDIRGLELRVWGDIKYLFNSARERFPWLPGNVVDAKHGVFTDSLGEEAEIRDMRKGIICIPCVGGNGEWIGIQKYCFPADTLIDTPQGQRRIDSIAAGDVVYCACGESPVSATMRRIAPELVRVSLASGTSFDCTPEHPFLTQYGWVEAKSLNNEHRLIKTNEIMRALRQGNPIAPALQHNLLQTGMFPRGPFQAVQTVRNEVLPIRHEDGLLLTQLLLEIQLAERSYRSEAFGTIHAGVSQEVWEKSERGHYGESGRAKAQIGSDSFQNQGGTFAVSEKELGSEAAESREGVRSVRERRRDVASGASAGESHARWDLQPGYQFRSRARRWIPALLSTGLRVAGSEPSRGIGWGITYPSTPDSAGQTQGNSASGSWVVCVEVLKRAGDPRYDESRGGYPVYNLAVESHPSYSVNGYLVHNCGIKQKRRRLLGDEVQFMRPAYMDAMANLDKGDFKGVFVGNPIGQGDPLDKMSEPIKGWDSLGEITKTTTWRNKFDGLTVNLVGIDSPNFDEPRGSKPKYPYMIAPEDADRVALRWGKDSVQYYSQIMGVRKPGLNAHRVLTREMCLRFGAFEDVIWSGKPTTKVYGIDASYGGDRCVGGFCEYGEDVNNIIVLKVHPPVIIPILVKSEDIPEDQIAHFVRADCDKGGIPPENVFYDSTGRGSLGTSFGRLWSTAVNPVEFGGTPTSRPVCHDIYVLDDRTKERRLKRCDEHYSKRVSEYWFSVRYTVESRQLRCMPQDVLDEFTMREWTMVKSDKIEIESKIDTKERMGCSPDLADWLAICVEGARRLGFRIERLTQPDGIERETRWLSEAVDRHKRFVRKTELSYQ